MAKKTAPKSESKVNIEAMFAEYLALNAQKKEIEKKMEKVKDFVKSTLPDEDGSTMTAGKFQATLSVATQERMASRDEFYAAFGEKVLRDKGLVKSSTQRTVTITQVTEVKDAFKKKGE